jgi:hypothetical protein
MRWLSVPRSCKISRKKSFLDILSFATLLKSTSVRTDRSRQHVTDVSSAYLTAKRPKLVGKEYRREVVDATTKMHRWCAYLRCAVKLSMLSFSQPGWSSRIELLTVKLLHKNIIAKHNFAIIIQ